jgi:hypothetical protein
MRYVGFKAFRGFIFDIISADFDLLQNRSRIDMAILSSIYAVNEKQNRSGC